jgi:hypothetical protein
MGWSRYSHTMRVWMFNSGFFYLRCARACVWICVCVCVCGVCVVPVCLPGAALSPPSL